MSNFGLWQRRHDECGIVCAAYFLNKIESSPRNLREVRRIIFPGGPHKSWGYLTSASDLRAFFVNYGYRLGRERKIGSGRRISVGNFEKYLKDTFKVDQLIKTNLRIAQNQWHWIYYDSDAGKLFDPLPWCNKYSMLSPVSAYSLTTVECEAVLEAAI